MACIDKSGESVFTKFDVGPHVTNGIVSHLISVLHVTSKRKKYVLFLAFAELAGDLAV